MSSILFGLLSSSMLGHFWQLALFLSRLGRCFPHVQGEVDSSLTYLAAIFPLYQACGFSHSLTFQPVLRLSESGSDVAQLLPSPGVTLHPSFSGASMWGTVPCMGNVAQPPLGKASWERSWRAEPTSMDRFSSGKSGLHCTLTAMRLALAKTPSP